MSAGKCRELRDALTVVPLPGLDAGELQAGQKLSAVPEGYCALFPREFFLIAKQGEESSESAQFLWSFVPGMGILETCMNFPAS